MPTINVMKTDKMIEAIKILMPTLDLLNSVLPVFKKYFFVTFCISLTDADSVLQLLVKDQQLCYVFVLVILHQNCWVQVEPWRLGSFSNHVYKEYPVFGEAIVM